ncbi:MAG: GNAT family N-acetyltransferase [Litorimonas sp.]
MLIPKIHTERLILRAPCSDDYEVYQAFYRDEQASAAYGGPLSDMLSWKKLAADLGHWSLRGFGMWSVQERESGDMIGGCGLVWPEGYPRSELTWWIIPTARRKGYAREASEAVIRFAYKDLKWNMVETHMNDDNIAAKKLVTKLGGIFLERASFPDGLDRNVYKFPQSI